MILVGKWNGNVYESRNFAWGEVREYPNNPEGYRWRATLYHERDAYTHHPTRETAKLALLTQLRGLITDLQEVYRDFSEERKLTAATAEHTTALEWTEQRSPTWDEACHILMDVHGPGTAVYEAARVLLDQIVELEFPKPGATTA